jgi:hypothetical protein
MGDCGSRIAAPMLSREPDDVHSIRRFAQREKPSTSPLASTEDFRARHALDLVGILSAVGLMSGQNFDCLECLLSHTKLPRACRQRGVRLEGQCPLG